jgi:hypothetical protein
VSRAPYDLQHTSTAQAALDALPESDRRDVETHLLGIRSDPLPSPGNAIRPYRGKSLDLLPEFEGPFWSRVSDVLVFHVVNRARRLVVLLIVVPQQDLDLE